MRGVDAQEPVPVGAGAGTAAAGLDAEQVVEHGHDEVVVEIPLARVDADRRWDVVGDPTEGAMLVVAAKAGLDTGRVAGLLPRLATVPFSSERQYMATLPDQALLTRALMVRILLVSTLLVAGSWWLFQWELAGGRAWPRPAPRR